DLVLECAVALEGVQEVRDQVVAALELDLDLRERLVDSQALLDEAVVGQDQEPDHDHDYHDQDDQRQAHAVAPPEFWTGSALGWSLSAGPPRTAAAGPAASRPLQ